MRSGRPWHTGPVLPARSGEIHLSTARYSWPRLESETAPLDSERIAAAVLSALPTAIVVVDGDNNVRHLNPAAENLLQVSGAHMAGHPLAEVVPIDHPLFGLIEQVRNGGHSLSEYGVTLDTPRIQTAPVTLQLAPLFDPDAETGAVGRSVVVAINQLSIAQKIDQQLTHRNAARSVSGMAGILAHEVKNPLAGIRGAAQLIEQGLRPEERELTRLICDETDRICSLVDRMDMFSEHRPLDRGPVNIHEVLEHVRRIAQNSFAQDVRFVENYDPSLPPVFGARDQLVQIFLNLVKNACDAVPVDDGEIVLSTAYRHGIRLALRGGTRRVDVPLVVSIQDNGPGIPEDLRDHLFDPFVTTKVDGHGLGLALVAKFVGDHAGVIEFDSEPRRTVFRVMLPVYLESEDQVK